MIPTIGIMVGAIGVSVCLYILMRAVSFAARTGDREESGTVKFFAFVAALASILAIAILCFLAADLILSGTQ